MRWRSLPGAVRLGVGVTLGWVLLLVWLTGLPFRCPGFEDVSFWQAWIWFGSCREPHELGDFLSGAFAPLAFMWLVIAVLVQADELKAQREVLEHTVAEAKENRAVAVASQQYMAMQAKAAGHHIELLEFQTTRQEETEAMRLFLDHMDEIKTYIVENFSAAKVGLGRRSLSFKEVRSVASPSKTISNATDAFERVNADAKDTGEGARIEADALTRQFLKELIHITGIGVDLSKLLPQERQWIADLYGLDGLVSAAKKLESLFSEPAQS